LEKLAKNSEKASEFKAAVTRILITTCTLYFWMFGLDYFKLFRTVVSNIFQHSYLILQKYEASLDIGAGG
jgi:hypothetical protein